MRLSLYQEDLKKQGEGTPVHYPSTNGAITFYLRRWGTRESEVRLKEIRRSLFGPLHKHSDEDLLTIYAHWLVEYGVSNWENLIDDNTKKEIPYSIETARQLFTDKSYFMSLNQKLINDALDFENYLQEDIEEVTEAIKKP